MFGISSDMGMSKRNKACVSILALGLGALAMDRLVVLPGPASASASDGLGDALPQVDLKAVSKLADSLLSSSQSIDSPLASPVSADAMARDAFADWKRVAEVVALAEEQPAARTPEPARPVQALPTLTAIVLTETGGYAVLNGKPLGVGASREGFTLVGVTAQSATVDMDGVKVTLLLAGERGSPQVSPG